MRTGAVLVVFVIGAVAITALQARRIDAGGTPLVVVAGGEFTCALLDSGGVKCWGAGSVGQLGDGTVTEHRQSPKKVVGLGMVKEIAAGAASGCAVTSDERLMCWGSNSFGQLGDGSTTNRLAPIEVSGLGAEIDDISAGTFHACALMTNGRVMCWGRNSYGQLGAASNDQCGAEVCALAPVEIPQLRGIVASISAGGNHTCAVTTGGGVKCWGDNGNGILGGHAPDVCDFNRSCSRTPTDVCLTVDVNSGRCVQVLAGMNSVSAGSVHNCGVTIEEEVKCWGASNLYGLLGNGGACLESCLPASVCSAAGDAQTSCSETMVGVVDVEVGATHSCAGLSNGQVMCWGSNAQGALGDNRECGLSCSVAVDVCADEACSSALQGAAGLTSGGLHTCAILIQNQIACWGANGFGQLGTVCCNDHQDVPVLLPQLEPKPLGDSNCNDEVTAIDAALVLQLEARLIDSLACSELADVNLDGLVNSIDALLTLQIVAGLHS